MTEPDPSPEPGRRVTFLQENPDRVPTWDVRVKFAMRAGGTPVIAMFMTMTHQLRAASAFDALQVALAHFRSLNSDLENARVDEAIVARAADPAV